MLQALEHPLADKRLQILRAVAQAGSISAAARTVGVSYKAAWQALDTLSNLAGTNLVERSVGGAGGGGAQLSPAGQALLQAAAGMDAARQELHQRWQQSPRGHADLAQPPTLPSLGLHTSMRNQWPCTVLSWQLHGALALVKLQAQHAPGMQLQARITAESAELLGIEAGQTLLALAKATALQVSAHHGADGQAPAPLPINTWLGHIQRIHPGTAGDEVAAQLPQGVQLVGFAPPQTAWPLGSTVRLHLPDSAVVLATTA